MIDTHSDEDLLAAARAGDQGGWERLVGRYQPLIDAITRRHRLPAADGQDVSQHVWVQLVKQGCRLRDPRALPGWISTTATRKCYELVRTSRRSVSVDPIGCGVFGRDDVEPVWSGSPAAVEVDEGLLREEQRVVVRRALAQLPASQQQLLMMLVADPPVPYREIGARTGLPVGSIGPTRARLLKKLRTSLVGVA